MNIQELDLMNVMNGNRNLNQRCLSDLTGYSLGKVNSSIKNLMRIGFVDERYNLTEKAEELFQKNKPQRAVILAAGIGMRMIPINTIVPKGLLEINGEPLIERLIKQLHEVGIQEIIIVVGFMKEQYEYLIDKYGVQLVFNEQYYEKNNLFSLKKVMHLLENSYIIPCDLWCKKNPFHQNELYSWYMVSNQLDEESFVKINRKKELKEINDEENGNKMIGIAYVCIEEAEQLKKQIEEKAHIKRYFHSFWEEAALLNHKMIFYPKEVSAEDVYEINTLEELRELDGNSEHLNSEILNIIVKQMDCDLNDITEITALKKGMTNRSFLFRCRDKRYIMRIPGEGTGEIINRQQEAEVYQVIGKEHICDPICYISPRNGYKITEFLENARVCDAFSKEDVKKCMHYLKGVHQKHLCVQHDFDLFQKIEQYESYWKGQESIYRDYRETKEKIYELKRFIDHQEKEYTLTHIDAVPDNFLFVNDRIYLIDWEYAGMQDPHVDIAMFAIYAMYDREHIEELIDFYFENMCPDIVRTKIYCYIAVCGLLWSNWCEYKRICGVEFGEYSLKQYRYAKEYYEIAKGRMKDE